MSGKNTERTLTVLVDGLEDVLNNNEPWEASQELQAKAKELADKGEVDAGTLREVARHNAEGHRLDFERADRVIDIAQKLGGSSYAATHMGSRRVWQGTGTSLSIVGPDIVHYIDRPGVVEGWYGPGLPYIVSKAVWMALVRREGRHELTSADGYRCLTINLRRIGQIGPEARPHIGAAHAEAYSVHRGYDIHKEDLVPVISSSSGTLVEKWIDDRYQSLSYYATRAVDDEAAGLFDGHIENRRAGLYDTEHSVQVIRALHGVNLNNRTLDFLEEVYDESVDIN